MTDPDATAVYWRMRQQYLALSQKFAGSLTAIRDVQRESARLHAAARWSMRTSTTARAVIVDGRLHLTTPAFVNLNRPTALPWRAQTDRRSVSSSRQAWPVLADLVVDEARAIVEEGPARRLGRFGRADQVIDLNVERTRSVGEETTVLATARLASASASDRDLTGLRSRLEKRRQQAAVGELAVEVAHDLGNLVSALSARLHLMHRHSTEPDRELDAAQAIVRAQAALVAKLRAQALIPQPPTPLQLLPDVVQPAVQIAESRLRCNQSAAMMTIDVDPSVEELPPVLGVREDLVNVIINLLVNAADAMPRGGTVQLTAVADEDGALLFVDDEGTGIPDHHLDQIFRPHFTTKGAAGSGLGLAMARQVLTGAGGDILAMNRARGGARFELSFRLADRDPILLGGAAGP
jgi:signal transduction histidine kinase